MYSQESQRILGIFRMTEVLTIAQLRRLTEHKYSAEGTSVLEPQFQIFWRWLVEQIPLWWAPNAISVIGLIINIGTALILCFYSPDGVSCCPLWTYFLCALGLFIYQSLDAIDGKQARRTNTCSPLGELFDHGCDSISTVFVTMSTVISLQLGTNPLVMFFFCVSSMVIFYTAHWQTYVTGTLKFGRLDVTEAQLGVISVYLISGVFGCNIWSITVPVLDVPLKLICVCISSAVALQMMIKNIRVIMKDGIGKNGATVADTSVVFPLFPMAVVVVLACMIAAKSTTDVYRAHPCLYIISFGMVGAKVTNKLVVAHMTKSEMSFLDTVLVGPGMLFFNQYFNNLVNEYVVLWLCCIYSTIDLVRYSAIVTVQICDYMNIYCFKIAIPQSNGDQGVEESKMVTRSQARVSGSVPKQE